MTFKDEQKQAEFEAFAAYYRLVAQRPHTSAKMSRMNQLESIIRGDYPGALQELRAEQRIASAQQAQERQLGKQAGGGQQTRRGSSPVVKLPQPGTARYERLKAAGLLPSQQAAQEQSGRLEAVKVVAGDDSKNFTEKLKRRTKEIAAVGAKADELSTVQLSTGATFDTEAGRTENDMVQDAVNLNAKDLAAKYGRDLIFEKLLELGETGDTLIEKTDRQLANLLKRIGA